ncbi:internal head protein [Pseudomonas phage 201phi2-1]|uniref:Virion structural protein n=1 Tax=Pseudomonas phage 201phi2-1 TaxID=198110 RepID=B3FJ21_BP201|nr:internal head protein [Pseudomonas phage 201phi2-1]ABY62988.1 virion structural protein [Pseudomonas phage 201phi2-1]
MTEVIELAPTTAVNAAPDVMSTLMELNPAIADEILELTHGIERYKNIRLLQPKLFELSLEATDQGSILSRMLDALIRFITRFIRDVYEGTATLSFSLGKLHDRAELINTESRSMRRTNRSNEFKIDTRIHNLCVNYKPINDPQRLLMVLKTNNVLFKSYFKYQNVELPNIIPNIVNINPKRPDSVIALVELLSPVSPMAKASAMNFSGDQTSRASLQLLGNQRLHAMTKNPVGDVVDQLAGQEWLLLPASDDPKPLPPSITYPVFAATIEQSILREIVSATTDLESNFGIVSRNRRSMRVDDLTRYLERLRNSILTKQYDAETEERAQQIIRMLEAYCTWLVNPYLNMMGLYIRNANAVLNVCDANN